MQCLYLRLNYLMAAKHQVWLTTWTMQAVPVISKSVVGKRLKKNRSIYYKKLALQLFIGKLKLKQWKEKWRCGTQRFWSALRACSWPGTPSTKPPARSDPCVRISSCASLQKLVLILTLVASQQWPGFLRVGWLVIHRRFRIKREKAGHRKWIDLLL